MKKYVSCFLFFFALIFACLAGLFLLTGRPERNEAVKVQMTESVEQPAFAASEETEEAHMVLNQEDVSGGRQAGNYCLVAEEGYLIVYDKNEEPVRLVTGMPLAELPVSEQERLMEGIWFFSMAELFSYLESCTS